jgi:hypothetical protein
VYTKRSDAGVVHVAVIVDDCVGFASSKQLADEFEALCAKNFDEYTIEWGPVLTILGMKVEFKPELGAVHVSQPHFVSELAKRGGVTWTAPTPALVSLRENDPTLPLLPAQEQQLFMSLNAGAMFAAKRCYPQCLPATTTLARRYGRATEADLVKVKRVLAYMQGTLSRDYHMCIRPTSIDSIVVAADSSFDDCEDAKSTSAMCVGFPCDDKASYFMFGTALQPVVAKTAWECELVCANYAIEYGLWGQFIMEQMGYGHLSIVLLQDNTSTISSIEQGHGTFKRTKHINVRYFWMKMLIDDGDLVLKWVSTKEMVADILSKPLVGSLFVSLLVLLLCWWN